MLYLQFSGWDYFSFVSETVLIKCYYNILKKLCCFWTNWELSYQMCSNRQLLILCTVLPCSGKNRLLEEPDCRVLPATQLFLYMMSHAHHESWLRKCRLFPNVGRVPFVTFIYFSMYSHIDVNIFSFIE